MSGLKRCFHKPRAPRAIPAEEPPDRGMDSTSESRCEVPQSGDRMTAE
jgi:hypothetical protein